MELLQDTGINDVAEVQGLFKGMSPCLEVCQSRVWQVRQQKTERFFTLMKKRSVLGSTPLDIIFNTFFSLLQKLERGINLFRITYCPYTHIKGNFTFAGGIP